MAFKKLSDKEILEMIRQFCDGGYETDQEDSEKMNLILRIYPGVSDLIFKDKRDLTPEQILEEAKKRKKVIHLA